MSSAEVGGIPGVAVECVDIGRNTSGAVSYTHLVCVGLDTDFSYLPADFVDSTLSKGENIVRFNKKLIRCV